MDKILMKNMSFYGYHGVMAEEKVLGQKFFIDVVLEVNLKSAGVTDSVENTVSYADVFQVVKDHAEVKRYHLLEALAENIASNVLENFHLVKAVEVEVRKPEAPVHGVFDHFGVHIRRERNV
ncbi:dihydroneopterin aldolase [Fusibacter sp. JL216-2]|uniref:dihydroneopterin aldolase n=1 Tax=Fusibacter sp. JL216-2 TaxID=3071453 RepID=UPI003D32A449